MGGPSSHGVTSGRSQSASHRQLSLPPKSYRTKDVSAEYALYDHQSLTIEFRKQAVSTVAHA